jgi:hypothetical protein
MGKKRGLEGEYVLIELSLHAIVGLFLISLINGGFDVANKSI